MPTRFTLNGQQISAPDDRRNMPLLWFIREQRGLKGTKYGCGIGQCGACTVHLNGAAVRSCLLKLEQVAQATITTIEGLAPHEEQLHPVQQAWIAIDVPQCGYCQAGQIMAAAALLAQNPNPSDRDIERGMTNICRCGSYVRIRKAVKEAAKAIQATK
jgi:isoquinoline 1-oxidoreductase subunit alpha